MSSLDELTSLKVADWLSPELRFDESGVGPYRLFDVYRHETRSAVCIVFASETQSFTVEIKPAPNGAVGLNAAGLDLSWQKPGPAEIGIEACRLVARRLTARLGVEARAWQVPPHAEGSLPQELAHEIELESARFEDDPDAAALTQDARHYERLYQAAPRPVRVRARNAVARGLSVHYPRPRNGFEPESAVYPAPARFVARRIFRRYLAALGCAFDAGEARIVPTPATFERTRSEVAPEGAPLHIELKRGRLPSVLARAWIDRVSRDHTLPVRVAPSWAVETYRVVRRACGRSPGPIDVGVLAHDVSLHALAFHAIPRRAWLVLTELASQKLARRTRPLRLARFFEEDLTRACWSVWRTVERPADFGAAFETVFEDLSQRLASL